MKKTLELMAVLCPVIKFNLKMKFTSILLLISLFQVYANTYSQNTKISLDLKGVKVEKVLSEIEKLTDFKFFIDTQKIDLERTVWVKANKQTVSKILNDIFKDTNVYFEVFNKQIILKNSIEKNKKQTLNTIQTINAEQQKSISGIVKDEKGLPIPGVNILEKGTSNGVQTDFNGSFSMNIINPNATLVVTYIGYKTQEIFIKGQSIINVVLQEDATKLEEVVLIGYGQQKSKNLTTAVSKINYETLKEQNVSSFEQALAGQIAGVQVSQTSGAPGGNISVKIRGTSLSGGQPLYVIDGVPVDNDLLGATGNVSTNEQPTNPLSSINPEDIQSISVLKDAAAAAIYGSRGSNGVVIVTTKTGKKGTMKVSYKHTFGLQNVLRKINVLDAYEYAQLSVDGQNENYIFNNPNSASGISITDPNGIRRGRGTIAPELYPYVNGITGLTNTDWQDEIFRTAEMTNHNLNISGGSDNSNYYVSGNFLKQDGIVINSGH